MIKNETTTVLKNDRRGLELLIGYLQYLQSLEDAYEFPITVQQVIRTWPQTDEEAQTVDHDGDLIITLKPVWNPNNFA